MMVVESAPGRATHVLVSYLPMVVLGVILIIVGVSPTAPHIGVVPLGNLFTLIGVILLVGAVLGMVFTHCPRDYVRWRIFCYREPDVEPDRVLGGYYRELVPERDRSH